MFADGSEDPSFSFDDSLFSFGLAFSDAFAQADGKVLITSDDPQLTVYGEQLRRLGTNGRLDRGFTLDARVVDDMVQRNRIDVLVFDDWTRLTRRPRRSMRSGKVSVGARVLAALSNGKILFSYLEADGNYKLVRLNSNGSLDRSFVMGVVPARGISIPFGAFLEDPQNPEETYQVFVVQNRAVPAFPPAISDAKELAGGATIVVGSFDRYNGKPARGIVELMPHGTLVPRVRFDAGGGAQWTQTPITDSQQPGIEKVVVQSNGNFLIVGTFEAFNGTPVPGIASLLPTGAVDPTFVAPAVRSKYSGHRTYLEKQSDGSYLLSGPYRRAGETQSPSFIRLIESSAQ